MKAQSILALGAVTFVAVLGGMQVDHLLSGHVQNTSPSQNSLMAPTPIDPVAFSTGGSGALDFRAAAKKVMPSVVSVDRYERVQRDFFDNTGVIAETGTGSGVIISSSGIIVTNNHVVSDESGQPVPEVKVRLHDKRTYKAKVIGTDPRSDLAVLKIEANNLTPIQIGSSASLAVGQWVMAVGNPLNFDDTVSVGVVSSLRRDLPVGAGGLVNAIQTDAAINPGNSGGALTDQYGRLVGINSAIASGTGQSVGIGFAIPVDRVRSVVDDIIKYGYARYAGLGISYPQNADGALGDPDVRAFLSQKTGATNVPGSGVIVMAVSGPAAQAGMQPYDVLLAVDGIKTDSTFAINKALIPKKPGQHATIKWWSKGVIKTAVVRLEEIGGPVQ